MQFVGESLIGRGDDERIGFYHFIPLPSLGAGPSSSARYLRPYQPLSAKAVTDGSGGRGPIGTIVRRARMAQLLMLIREVVQELA